MSYKQRQNAMKRYFTYVDSEREFLKKPWLVTFKGEEYTVFTNSYSAALTKEKCEDLEYVVDCEVFPRLERHIDYGGLKKKVNLSEVIKRAKEQGYKLSKKEVNPGFKFLLYYDNSYYKMGLVHATYRIIDNDGISFVHHKGEITSPLVISNEFGMCIIMPMKYDSDYYIKKNGNIVINLIDE